MINGIAMTGSAPIPYKKPRRRPTWAASTRPAISAAAWASKDCRSWRSLSSRWHADHRRLHFIPHGRIQPGGRRHCGASHRVVRPRLHPPRRVSDLKSPSPTVMTARICRSTSTRIRAQCRGPTGGGFGGFAVVAAAVAAPPAPSTAARARTSRPTPFPSTPLRSTRRCPAGHATMPAAGGGRGGRGGRGAGAAAGRGAGGGGAGGGGGRGAFAADAGLRPRVVLQFPEVPPTCCFPEPWAAVRPSPTGPWWWICRSAPVTW